MKPKHYTGPFALALAALATAPSASADSNSWNINAAGSWATASNWLGGVNIPGSTSDTTSTDIATFGFTLGANRIVTVDANRNIGGITFADNNTNFRYTLSGGNLLLTSAGVIQVDSTATAGTHTDTISSAIAIQGDGGTATFSNNGASTRLLSIGAVTGVSTGTNITTLTLNGSNTGASAIAGIIGDGVAGGKLAITKSDFGTWALTNATNSYTGNTTVLEGKLSVTSSTAFASPNISISSGATFSFANASGTLGYHNVNATKNTISGAGTLMKEGAGAVDISASGRGTTISLSSGALIDIQAGTLRNGTFGNADWTNNRADLNVGPSGTFDTWNGAPIRVDAITGSGTITNLINGLGSVTFGVDNGFGEFTGTISNQINLVKNGSGTQTLSGNNTFTGTTTSTAGTLALSSNLALQNSALVTTGAGSITLGAGVTTPTFGGLSGASGNLATIIASGYGGVTLLTLNPLSGSFSYGGVIADGAAGMNLVKTGAGTQTLSGANSYTGSTTVQQGKLTVTSSTAFASPNISISSGATFSFANASGTLSYNNATNNTISGAGTLMKEGAGTVDISANGKGTTISLSSGALIDIQAGTLRNGTFANANWTNNLADLNIGSSGTFNTWNGAPIRVDAITGSGRIINLTAASGTLTFGVDNGSGEFTGTISNLINLVKNGSGTQTFSGTNTYTGTTTISAGTLALGAGNVLPDTTAVAIGGATLSITASVSDTAGTLDPTAAATIQIGSGASLAFANSSAINWTGGTLQITGNFVSGSSLRFGTDNTGLTSGPTGQLSKISAVGFTGFALDTNGFLIATSTGGFTAWQSANSTSGAINADHDNDGVSNGIEYFLGGTTNTTGFTGPLPGVDKALDGTLSVTWTKAATYTGSYGTSFVVQTSTTLAADSWSEETLPGTVTISGNNVTYTFPAGTKRFARLQVVNP